MFYKDIQHKHGTKFFFKKDMDDDNVIPYMVVDIRGIMSCWSAIVDLTTGRLAGFGEYDSILNDEILTHKDM